MMFSRRWLLFFLGLGILLFPHQSHAQTNEGTIETEIWYDNGKIVNYDGLVVKIFQDFSGDPYRILDSISSNPYKISGLPMDHKYTVQVYRHGMYSGENTLELKSDLEKLTVEIFLPLRINFKVYYNDGQTPINEAKLSLTSYNGIPVGESITDEDGKTDDFRPQPTTRLNENYVANVTIKDGISFTYSPILLPKRTRDDVNIVTPWPVIIDSLITVKLYDNNLKEFTPAKENFLVEMYDSKNNKVAESKVNYRGTAFFSNVKVDIYDFRVVKQEPLKTTEWRSIKSIIDGNQNEIKIIGMPTTAIVEGNQTETKIPGTGTNETQTEIIRPQTKFNVALVEPSFTNAAYKDGAFYNFYAKYGFPPIGTEITKDLDMLTSTLPKGPFRTWDQKESEEDSPLQDNYFVFMEEEVSKVLPDSRITKIKDEDVHRGKIFDSNGNNLYDLIILFHQEYVTGEEYQNFKKFVENGGTIFFSMSNLFTVEVTYSEQTNSIRFVKGHDWEFDGKIARPSVAERWVDETKDWAGSNFLTDPAFIPITYPDNPFDYRHIEEQYISNPNDTILLDFQANYPKDHKFNPTVASYELNHGKGKVISSSIWGPSVRTSPNLSSFYENIIFPRAVGSLIELKTTYGVFPLFWLSQSSQVSQIDFNESDKKIELSVSGKKTEGETLRVVIPNDLLGADPFGKLKIAMNNKTIPYEYYSDDIETGFSIPVPDSGNKIQISPIIPKTFSKFSIQRMVEGFKFTHNYQCVPVSSGHHCDYAPNKLLAFNGRSDATEIYTSIIKPATFVEGAKGKALELHAPRMESLSVPYSDLTTTRFSVSFFVKPSDDSEPFGVIISNLGSDKKSGWFIDMTSDENEHLLSFNLFTDQGSFKVDDILITPKKFTNVVVTFDGKSMKVFKDTNLIDESMVKGNYVLPDTAIRMGSQAWSFSTQRWSGIIDEVYLYSKVLGSEEIKNMNSFSANIPKDNIIFYYPFDNDGLDHSANKAEAKIRTMIPSMVFAPDGRLFFSEKNTGNIRIMKNDKVFEEPFFHVNDYFVSWEQGLLGLAIDPKFEQNRFVYLYYVYQDHETGKIFNRILRLVDDNSKGKDPVVILDKIFAEKGYHSGGAMAFGADDKLYITVGDASQHPFAQDPNILIGKVLRINRDGTIPSDNPFNNSPVYNIGHRNSFGIAFDRSGYGIMTENGDVLYDEVDNIIKGADYGFPFFEEPNLNPYLFNSTKSEAPLIIFYNTPAPTQAIFYDGKKFPELYGKFVFAAYDGHLFSIDMDNVTKKVKSYNRIFLNSTTIEPAIGLAQSPEGDIYYSAYSIHKLSKIEVGKDSFIINVEVKSNSESIPYDRIDITPSKDQLTLGTGAGQMVPNLIEIPLGINPVIDVIADKNANQYDFIQYKIPASETLKFLINYNDTGLISPPSTDETKSVVENEDNPEKNAWDSFIDWINQIFHLS